MDEQGRYGGQSSRCAIGSGRSQGAHACVTFRLFYQPHCCAHTDAGLLLWHSLKDCAGLCHGGPRSRRRRSARCRRGDEDRAFYFSFVFEPPSSPLTVFFAYRSTFFAQPSLAKWKRSLSKRATWSRKERCSSRSWRRQRKRQQTRPKRRPRISKTCIQITTAFHGWIGPSSSCTSVLEASFERPSTLAFFVIVSRLFLVRLLVLRAERYLISVGHLVVRHREHELLVAACSILDDGRLEVEVELPELVAFELDQTELR